MSTVTRAAPDRAPSLAILTYIDATPQMLEEFGWLYKSWIHSGNWLGSDIVAVCHPDVAAELPDEPGVVKIPRAPLSGVGGPWEGYPFINSIGCLVGPHMEGLADRYSHILRTDADVFLTAGLRGYRPSFYTFGRGRYVQNAEVRAKIVAFAETLGLTHHGVYNCGSSMLGPAAGALTFLYNQFAICTHLNEAFRGDPGVWPGWSKNTMTMYAAEIVANHYRDAYLYNAYFNVLDFETYRDDDIAASNVLHIHALHSEAYWSKFIHRQGGYAGLPTADLDQSRVNTYCHWIAATRADHIKALCGYPW